MKSLTDAIAGIQRVLLVLAGLFLVVSAQAQNNILHRFYGGHMESKISMNSMMMTGPGIRSVCGGGVAPAFDDVFAIFRNPAGMRYTFDRPRFGFTFHPKLGIEWDMTEDVQTEVEKQMDDNLTSFRREGPFTYPTVGGGIWQKGSSISSFAMTFPKYPWQFGLGYMRPYYFNLDFIYGGLSELIESKQEGEDAVPINALMQVKMDLSLTVVADAWTVAVAKDVGDAWTGGISLTRNYFNIDIQSGMLVDGMMIMSGEGHAFNDPRDGWYNNLQGWARGGYDGESWTARLGTQYVPWAEESWRFGAELKVATKANLTGYMPLKIDEFPAMKLQTKEGEENFDANRVDVDELTKTVPNYYQASNSMTLFTPSSVSIGVSRGKGIRPVLRLTKYLGKLGFELEMQEKVYHDSTVSPYTKNVYSRGIKPNWEAYLAIAPTHFFMGMGVIYAKDFVSGYKDDNGVPIVGNSKFFIPRFDLGFTINIAKNMQYELLIDGLPEDVFRMGISYVF